MNQRRQRYTPWISNIATILLLAAGMPTLAADPSYIFNLMEDHQPELCARMKTVFNTNFQHMWTDPVPTTTQGQDRIYLYSSEYAFPLLPGTLRNTRMTMTMRRSKIPSSPEFDAIQWHEGHTVFVG